MRQIPAGAIKQAVTAVGMAAILIAGLEGYKTKGYLDPVKIPTVCFGHIQYVDMTKIYTKPECYALLDADTLIAAKAVDRLVDVPLSENQKTSLISFVFNVGEGAFAKSTLRRLLNDFQYENACRQMPLWIYAKGKKLRGLVTRRAAEMNKCLTPDTVETKEKDIIA